MFINRTTAGTLLAEKLKKFQGQPGVILAVPRGGVPVAYAVAKELGLPLDIILTKKLGHPVNPEYAIGAVSLTDYFVSPYAGVSADYIEKEVAAIRKKLKEMHARISGNKKPVQVRDKIVILIDDGIATGSTILGTVQMLKKDKPSKIIAASPVASKAAVRILSREVDEVITVLEPENFYAVGAFYEDFDEVTDEEVMYYLNRWRQEMKQTG